MKGKQERVPDLDKYLEGNDDIHLFIQQYEGFTDLKIAR